MNGFSIVCASVTATLVFLKLAGEIGMSWWIVTVLVWAPVVAALIASFLVAGFMAYANESVKRKAEK